MGNQKSKISVQSRDVENNGRKGGEGCETFFVLQYNGTEYLSGSTFHISNVEPRVLSTGLTALQEDFIKWLKGKSFQVECIGDNPITWTSGFDDIWVYPMIVVENSTKQTFHFLIDTTDGEIICPFSIKGYTDLSIKLR